MVNTREIAAEYRLSHWAGVMRERLESGMSIKAYCRQIGICGNTYYYWQRRLRAAACEGLGMSAAEGTSLPGAGFTEVRLAEAPARIAVPATDEPGQLHIEVAGLRITADSGYPPERLAALLLEMKRQC